MTARHVGDELYDLLRGELPNRQMAAVNDHLKVCEHCRVELVDASLAHALLLSVSDVLTPELIRGPGAAGEGDSELAPLEFLHTSAAPDSGPGRYGHTGSPSVRPAHGYERGIRAELTSPATPAIVPPAGSGRSHLRRAVASAPSGPRTHRRLARRRAGIGALVALVLALATCLGIGSERLFGPSGTPRVLLTAELLPLPAAPTAAGQVTVGSNGGLTITTRGLAPAPKGQHYEVWLVDPARPTELALGVLPATGTGRFSFPARLWHFDDGVSVSLQLNGVGSTGVAMLSTLKSSQSSNPPPAAHSTTHAKATVTKGSHHHRHAPPGHRRAHHSQGSHPSPSVSSASHTPPSVQRLLGGGAPHVPAGRVLRVDTTEDGEAVDPASGLCRDTSGRCSLRAAIEVADASRHSTTIRLPAGTYELTLGTLEVTATAGVTIVGASSGSTLIEVAGDPSRLLVVGRVAGTQPRKAVAVALEHLTLEGGTAPSAGRFGGLGGDLLVAGRSDLLELSHVRVNAGTASVAGGGLYSNGQLWAASARFAGDHAGTAGGAVMLRGTQAVITQSTFSGDSTGADGQVSGGAVADEGLALVLVYSSFADDSSTGAASARGGALALFGAAWLSGDAFVGDHVSASSTQPAAAPSAEGGAVYAASALATIVGSTFDGDSAQAAVAAGGAVFTSGQLTVASSHFVANVTTESSAPATAATGGAGTSAGGGAIAASGHLSLEASWLSRNATEGDGGAVLVSGPSDITDCLLAHNLASGAGGAVYDTGALVIVATTLSHDRAASGGGLVVAGSVRARGDAIVDNVATGAEGAGGGVLLAAGGTAAPRLVLRRSTVAGNVAVFGAGIASEAVPGQHPVAYLYRSIISANDLSSGAEQDCAAAGTASTAFVVSEGGNVAGDTSCHLAASTDRQGPSEQAYWLASATGAVRACRLATYGSAAGTSGSSPIVAIAAAPGNDGYWEVAADGVVDNFGSAGWFGSAQGKLAGASVSGFATTLDGEGYWIVTSRGAVLNFGDAGYYGSARGVHVVAMARSVDGRGYWLLAGDGRVFAFGDAPHEGEHTGIVAVAISPTPDGEGYWVASATGAVFAFGNAGAFGGTSTEGVVAILPSPDGRGYLLVTHRGQVLAFGDAVGAHAASHTVAAAASV